MLDRNVFRHKCRKAAGNPRSPRSIAATPACDNVWLTRERRREREGDRGGRRRERWKSALKNLKWRILLWRKKEQTKRKEKGDNVTDWMNQKHEGEQTGARCSLASVGLRRRNQGNSIPSTPRRWGRTSPTRLAMSPLTSAQKDPRGSKNGWNPKESERLSYPTIRRRSGRPCVCYTVFIIFTFSPLL